jgi:hypothetical protein
MVLYRTSVDLSTPSLNNNNASVPEMALCTFFSRSDSLDTPLKERGESLVRALLISPPIPPDERLQLREKLLDGIQIR